MTSWYGSTFYIAGPLWRESIRHWYSTSSRKLTINIHNMVVRNKLMIGVCIVWACCLRMGGCVCDAFWYITGLRLQVLPLARLYTNFIQTIDLHPYISHILKLNLFVSIYLSIWLSIHFSSPVACCYIWQAIIYYNSLDNYLLTVSMMIYYPLCYDYTLMYSIFHQINISNNNRCH